jgi:hypothetical protein
MPIRATGSYDGKSAGLGKSGDKSSPSDGGFLSSLRIKGPTPAEPLRGETQAVGAQGLCQVYKLHVVYNQVKPNAAARTRASTWWHLFLMMIVV